MIASGAAAISALSRMLQLQLSRGVLVGKRSRP